MKIEQMQDRSDPYYLATLLYNHKVIMKEGLTMVDAMAGIVQELINHRDSPTEALLNHSDETGKPLCECLAEMCSKSLITDDLDPMHVDGIEFAKCLDSKMVSASMNRN